MDVDVVVVGAGLSGVRTADLLSEAGLSVRILEASERIGGRAHTIEAGGTFIDMGGQWIGPDHVRVVALCQRLGVETFDFHTVGENLLVRGDDIVRFTDSPPLSHEELSDIEDAEQRIRDLAIRLDPADPMADAELAALDRITYGQWIDQNVSTQAARDYLTMHLRTITCGNENETSALYMVLSERTGPTDGSYEDWRLTGGAQQLVTGLLDEITGAQGTRATVEVRNNDPVHLIEQGDESARVHHASGVTSARYVVIALSPPMTTRITFSPPLSARRDLMLQRMPMGTVIKFHAVYPTPFWREDGLSGASLLVGRSIGQTADNSPPDASRGVLGFFFYADACRSWLDASPSQRRDAAIADLVFLFGEQAREPIAFTEANWCAHEWVRGGYDAVPMPGALGFDWATLREPVSRVHFCGTETSTQWPGYYEGALVSAQRVAAEILTTS